MVEEKPLIEHYADLRNMVISTIICFLCMFVIGMISLRWTLPFFMKEYELIMLGPMDVIKLYVKVAGAIALGLSIPFAGWQLWKFVSPALTASEKRYTLLYVPAMIVFFISGIMFGYWIVYPIVYTFLIHLGELHFSMMITASEYFSFLILTTLPFGFLFQLPIAIMFLTSIGLITPVQLSKVRKYAYFVLVVLSVLITPPDFISDVLVIVPLFLLYELGVIMSKIIFKRKIRLAELGEAS